MIRREPPPRIRFIDFGEAEFGPFDRTDYAEMMNRLDATHIIAKMGLAERNTRAEDEKAEEATGGVERSYIYSCLRRYVCIYNWC